MATSTRLGPAAVSARVDALTDGALRRLEVVSLAAPELLDLPASLRHGDGESVYAAPRVVRTRP